MNAAYTSENFVNVQKTRGSAVRSASRFMTPSFGDAAGAYPCGLAA